MNAPFQPNHANALGHASTSVLDKLNCIQWLTLHFEARANQPMRLNNPWSDLHGGFGMMLRRVAPHAWDAFFGERQGSGDVRPYVLRPGHELLHVVDAGEAFSFELVLIGSAIDHASDCIQTLMALGRQGLTQHRFGFELTAVFRVQADHGLTPLSAVDGLRQASDVSALIAGLDPAFTSDAHLVLQSPLRLKHQDRTLECAPPADLLANRLVSRIKALSVQLLGSPLLNAQEHAHLVDLAQSCELVDAETQFVKINRWSSRQMASMDMMGVVGRFTYRAVPLPLFALFLLGQWVHAGSNTTFGFGSYRLGLAD